MHDTIMTNSFSSSDPATIPAMPADCDVPFEQILWTSLNSHLIVAISDADGRIIFANEQFCTISGYKQIELIGENHRILKSGRHGAGFYRELWDTISSGRVWRGRICNRAKSGRLYWVETSIFPILGEDGSPVGYLSLRSDVTELLRSYTEARRQAGAVSQSNSAGDLTEQQLLMLFDFSPIGISWREVDKEGNPTVNHVNSRFAEIIGLSVEEAKDIRNIERISHPDDWAEQQIKTAAIYSGEADEFNLEKRYIHPDGRVIWGSLTVNVLRDKSGRVTHHFATLEDVTARHSAQESLQRSESRWRTYLETASEVLFALTPTLHFKFVSPAWAEKLGHPIDLVLGHSFFEFVHPDDVGLCRKFIRQVLDGEERPDYVEFRAQHINGSYLWCATTGSGYRDRDQQRAFFGVARDISRRKKTEDELKHSLARLEELERIINRSPAVVVLWRAANGSWPVEFVSNSVTQFGYSPEQFIQDGLTFLDITHPEDRERIAAEIEAHASSGDDEYNQEYRILRKDGTYRHVEDHTIVRRAEDGSVSHHEGIINDVTERKAVEEREREATMRELQVAREVQLHLLPSSFPEMPDVEINALAQASLALGGDYFDVFEIDDQHLGLVIADVSGKGAPAALMMAACRASLRNIARDKTSPSEVMTLLNESIQHDMPPGLFITAFYGILNRETRQLTYCRCGHEPGMILRAGQDEPIFLRAGGMALGMTESGMFSEFLEQGSFQLEREDLLILYTDGINEATNAQGEEYGIDRMVTFFRRYRDADLTAMIQKIERHLKQFSALSKTLDDRTLLLLRTR